VSAFHAQFYVDLIYTCKEDFLPFGKKTPINNLHNPELPWLVARKVLAKSL
jgi:hypothetical protein